MDPIHDRLVSEVPIDAVSNLVNKSITQYKDGKDAALIGGQKDNDDINTKTNDFYERMKEVVQKLLVLISVHQNNSLKLSVILSLKHKQFLLVRLSKSTMIVF